MERQVTTVSPICKLDKNFKTTINMLDNYVQNSKVIINMARIKYVFEIYFILAMFMVTFAHMYLIIMT